MFNLNTKQDNEKKDLKNEEAQKYIEPNSMKEADEILNSVVTHAISIVDMLKKN